ncbi:MAG: heavy metal translocating P-type ATPase metal-binding domain-containing protein [Bacteroidia bacterium]|nr:heavy metal translocating P-type ATPase metal-binding domain-containing protein [Bacteroidia bacterium]
MIESGPLRYSGQTGERKAPLVCFHCGDVCFSDEIALGDKYFCCNGCKAVYELLHANDLCAYYDVDEAVRGKSPHDQIYGSRYAYLDDPAIEEQLLEFTDGDVRMATFSIPSMHCSSCIWLLERLNALNPGIVSSRVDFTRREAAITWKASMITLKGVVTLLASVGYEPHISLQSVAEKRRGSSNKRLYYKIGIAGFAFGNVMLLSFPEYLAGEGGIDPLFARIFSYINIGLSLPVFFYSSLEYFQSAWAGLRQRFLNIDVPLSLGISMLFFRSIYDILSGTGPGYLDSFTGLVFFLLIGKIFQKKTYDALSFERDFRSYFPLSVAVKEQHHETTIPLTRLRVGQRIVVRNQELIPADAILLNGEANIDYSFVTGEAELIRKFSGDRIHAGGRQVGQAIELEVVKEIEQSYLTRLWNNDVFTKERRAPLTALVDRISARFTYAVLSIALVASVVWLVLEPGMVTFVFTSVLIVACPCALALASPFALGSAQRVYGYNEFFVKSTDTVEMLSHIDTIVFDKTGTLTRSGAGGVRFHGPGLNEQERLLIKSVLRQSTHTLSRQVFAFLADVPTADVEGYSEIPGKGIEGSVQGRRVLIGSADWAWRDHDAPIDTATTSVYVSIDSQPRGHFTVPNVYRDGLPELVARLRSRYRLAILSGDSPREEARLKALFGEDVPMRFLQTPADKLGYVETLRSQGRHVLMLGDGLNDAGALKAADVGVSLTEDINAFSPACDGILSADRFHTFDRMLDFARNSHAIVRASFILSLTYNVIGISFAVAGLLTPLVSAVLMPVSSVSVVAFTTLLTRWYARKRRLA